MLYPVLAAVSKGMVHFLYLYSWLIVIDTALTLFTRPKDKPNRIKLILKRMTEPVNKISRNLINRMSGVTLPVDISPILSLIAIWVVINLLNKFYQYWYLF